MSRWAFWRNAAVVGLIHLIVLAGLARWSGSAKPPISAGVVWVDSGALTLADVPASEAQSAEPEPTPTPEPSVTPMEDPLTMRTPPPEEADKPTPTATPRATPKPTPEQSGKKSKIVAKRTPKPTAKKAIPSKRPSSAAKPEAKRSGSGSGQAGTGTAASPSEVSWYADMLHDRFNRAWEQPTSVTANGARLAVRVHLRIETDGRVSEFKVVRSSGNVVVDESVQAVAARVTRVDPPPAALITGGACQLNITFDWTGR